MALSGLHSGTSNWLQRDIICGWGRFSKGAWGSLQPPVNFMPRLELLEAGNDIWSPDGRLPSPRPAFGLLRGAHGIQADGGSVVVLGYWFG